VALPSLLAASPLPYIRFSGLTTVTVNNNTLTTFTWDGVIRSKFWPSPSIPASAIVCPLTGLLLISVFDLDWGSVNNTAGYRALGVSFNGGTVQRFWSPGPSPTTTANSSNTAQSAAHEFEVTAGDTIDIKLRQDSGSNLTPAIVQLLLAYKRIGNL
jgi:hypothetical protein